MQQWANWQLVSESVDNSTPDPSDDRTRADQLTELLQRAIFTGGGATVRVGRIIGASRMVDMMLAARTFDVERGYELGLCHEIVDKGKALERAIALAHQVSEHAPLSNYAIVTSISRINDMSTTDGLFAESLMAAVVQSGPEVAAGLDNFLSKKAKRLK